ncbi:hypothetical protein D5S17_01820 [Pseudonocardiaceae bacterium YIM PH 21723]|nr:hypothetical protein D5S17_01820 [Pseudonocardiaceae bacterium YIM PH 21723]
MMSFSLSVRAVDAAWDRPRLGEPPLVLDLPFDPSWRELAESGVDRAELGEMLRVLSLPTHGREARLRGPEGELRSITAERGGRAVRATRFEDEIRIGWIRPQDLSAAIVDHLSPLHPGSGAASEPLVVSQFGCRATDRLGREHRAGTITVLDTRRGRYVVRAGLPIRPADKAAIIALLDTEAAQFPV